MRRLTPTAEIAEAFRRTIPLGMYGEKRDIADLAVYLSSDKGRYITGAIIYCDGGSSLTGGAATSFIDP